MTSPKESCVKPTKGPILADVTSDSTDQFVQQTKGEVKMIARVGKPAPDFEASAYTGNGFSNIRLSDHKGKWVVLCFYPGDFTFV